MVPASAHKGLSRARMTTGCPACLLCSKLRVDSVLCLPLAALAPRSRVPPPLACACQCARLSRLAMDGKAFGGRLLFFVIKWD